MLRLIVAIVLTPLLLKLPYLIPPYDTYTMWWFRIEMLFAYAAMALFGVPLMLFFIRKNWLRWWQVSLGATLASALMVMVYFLLTNWQHFLANGPGVTAYGLLSGFFSGLAFWVIAFWRNPRFIQADAAPRRDLAQAVRPNDKSVV